MYSTWHFYPQELHRYSVHFTSLHLKIKSLHINHVSSLHITSLIYTQSPLEFSCLYTLTNDRIVKQVKQIDGNNQTLPIQLGEPRFLSRYTEQATGWTIRGFIPGRGKRFIIIIF
jgi:hypothetical protein